MRDAYFNRPLFYDYLIGVIICALLYFFNWKHVLSIPDKDISISTATDLATIALTLAGFVITLLTVLITFKTGAKIPNGSNNEDLPIFDLFFSTRLYYQTTDLLKGCIKSLVFISILGFSLKLFLNNSLIQYIFFSNVLGLVIITTTLLRSLMILTGIINLQKEH